MASVTSVSLLCCLKGELVLQPTGCWLCSLRRTERLKPQCFLPASSALTRVPSPSWARFPSGCLGCREFLKGAWDVSLKIHLRTGPLASQLSLLSRPWKDHVSLAVESREWEALGSQNVSSVRADSSVVIHGRCSLHFCWLREQMSLSPTTSMHDMTFPVVLMTCVLSGMGQLWPVPQRVLTSGRAAVDWIPCGPSVRIRSGKLS